jgi:hypothetical protein
MLLNLPKTFQNRRDCHWPAFKQVSAVLPTFHKRIVHRQPFGQISKLARWSLVSFQNLPLQLQGICHPIMVKGFELKGFEKLSANLKAFGAKQLRTY